MPFVPDKPTPGFVPDQVSQNPQNQITPDAADKTAHGMRDQLTASDLAADSRLKQAQSQSSVGQRLKDLFVGGPTNPATQQGAVGDSLGAAAGVIPTDAAPAAIGTIAKYLGSSAPLRIASNAGAGAVQGAINNPEDRAGGALRGGAIAGGISGLGEAVSGISNKLADYFMQKAVGMRKYSPGIGNQLADMGVVGTKNMMTNQVEDKLAAEEEGLQDLVKDLKGTVNSKEIADAVSNKAQRFTLPSSGEASPFSENELQKVRDLSSKLSKMGDLSASDLLSLKRQGDYQGFTASGNPATSTEADLGRTGANAARTALKKMDPSIADSLLNEQALIKAKTSLMKPESIHQGVGSSLFFGKVPGQSLLGSAGAQLLQQGVSKPASLFANPLVAQEVTNKINQ